MFQTSLTSQTALWKFPLSFYCKRWERATTKTILCYLIPVGKTEFPPPFLTLKLSHGKLPAAIKEVSCSAQGNISEAYSWCQKRGDGDDEDIGGNDCDIVDIDDDDGDDDDGDDYDDDDDDDDDEDIGGNDCDKVDIVCKVVGRLVNVFANHFACRVINIMVIT